MSSKPFAGSAPCRMSSRHPAAIGLSSAPGTAKTRAPRSDECPAVIRAPLFAAEADPACGVLKRDTERIVIPRQQIEGEDGLMGNFHVTQLGDDRALVSDAAMFYKHQADRLMVADVRPD